MMTKDLLIVVSLLFCLLRSSLSAPAQDEITSLPGLNTKINFKQYGGYITVNETSGRNLFYWFVESQNDPVKDPLILWLQGGPGCSSLFGFLTEHGPFKISPNLEVVLNPYSWNMNASVIYLESPAGVGFSYQSDGKLMNGDNETMAEAYIFLQKWFALYPEFQSNDFYVSGESYGGHYVPQLSWTILNGKANPPIKLKGMLAGNPYTDQNIDTWSIPPFIFYHHLCSLPTYLAVQKACMDNTTGYFDDLELPIQPLDLLDSSARFFDHHPRVLAGVTDDCDSALNKMYAEVGNNINQYDIYFPCLVGAGLDCSNYTAETDFLNNAAVQKAIHAKAPSSPWSVCADVNYEDSWASVIQIYPQLMDNMHVVVYAGDVTYNVPALGTEIWVEGLNRKVVDNYQAWNVDGQVAGYYKKFAGITFVTVKDSGHMVPTFTPLAGKVLLENYLSGMF